MPAFLCRHPVAALLLGVSCLPAAGGAAALGVDDPVVSYGLAEVADWATAPVFLDRARFMRPFFAFGAEWQTLSPDELRAGGYLDPAGYPVAIPDGSAGLRTGWDWNPRFGGAERAGLYVFRYSGSGTITLSGDAVVRQSAPGRIVFENRAGGAVWIEITAITPGDHPRDFSVLRADDIALAEAGAIFDPGWLALVADARELRFLGWMRANSETQPAWEDRAKQGDATYADRGVPAEVMIRLANEAGVDPWFTVPHSAGPDDIRRLATLVRDGLDPRLKVHVEYSNETWNGAFPQFSWLRDRAVEDWGVDADDWEAIFDYHVKRAAEVALVWEDVFGPEAGSRLVNVLGTQAGNAWHTEGQLTAAAWRKREPDRYVAPASIFEEVAATTYFGGAIMGDPGLRREVRLRAAESPGAAHRWLQKMLEDPHGIDDSLPRVLERLAEQKAIVASAGMRFVAYEGGQHVHHSFAVDGLDPAEAEALAETMAGFVRSPEMAELYAELWEGWRSIGDGPFMQFTEMEAPTPWGSWGLLAFPGDLPPRAGVVLARQAEGGSWWNEEGGAQYRQGRTANGTETADIMEGTEEEDFLAGLGGDDSFPESGGQDGINGGSGADSYVLSAPADAYEIVPDGAGFRVTGPSGSAWLVNVETLRFPDGSTVDLTVP